MGFLDNIGKALKKVEEDIQGTDPGRQPKNAGENVNRAGGVAGKTGENTAPAGPAASLPAAPSAALPAAGQERRPHPGYARIAAWMKAKYRDRIAGTGGDQQGIQLEKITTEASNGLSAKVREGFREYLKKQNYEPLLR